MAREHMKLQGQHLPVELKGWVGCGAPGDALRTGWARLISKIPAFPYDQWRHLNVWLWCLSSAYLLLPLQALVQRSIEPGAAWRGCISRVIPKGWQSVPFFWKAPWWGTLSQDAFLDASSDCVRKSGFTPAEPRHWSEMLPFLCSLRLLPGGNSGLRDAAAALRDSVNEAVA